MWSKTTLTGATKRLPCLTHVPESGMVKVLALKMMVSLPLAVPVTVGAKATVKEVFSPGASVLGKDSPFRLNPVPLME